MTAPHKSDQLICISIIIPVYNVELYIRQCIESIIEQETCQASLECLIVDDCTPDNSMDIVHSIVDDYNGPIHFVFLKHVHNRGLSAARNTAINVATGDYILFVDSDDMLKPGAISCFIEALKNNGGNDVDVVMGNFIYNKTNRRMQFDQDTPFFLDNTDESALLLLLSQKIRHNAWNKLVKKEFFTEQQLYFREGIINEDLLWTYLLFRQMKNIVIIPDITHIYNEYNTNSITNTSDKRAKKTIESRIIIFNTILDNPPRLQASRTDYYSYILFFLVKTIDTFESNKNLTSDYLENLRSLKVRFLKDVWKNRLYLFYFFSLIIVKPFSHLLCLRLYRRHFWKILETTVSLQKRLTCSANH